MPSPPPPKAARTMGDAYCRHSSIRRRSHRLRGDERTHTVAPNSVPSYLLVVVVVLHYLKTPTPCVWQAPASYPENQKENKAGHSSERTVEGGQGGPTGPGFGSQPEGPGPVKARKVGGQARPASPLTGGRGRARQHKSAKTMAGDHESTHHNHHNENTPRGL